MKESNNLELRKVLMKLGITANLQGYHYILEVVKILEKQKIHTNITTIYEMIAKKCDNTKGAVERSIRHAIELSYNKVKYLNKIYNEKPDNSVLLYDLVYNFDIIKKEIEK